MYTYNPPSLFDKSPTDPLSPPLPFQHPVPLLKHLQPLCIYAKFANFNVFPLPPPCLSFRHKMLPSIRQVGVFQDFCFMYILLKKKQIILLKALPPFPSPPDMMHTIFVQIRERPLHKSGNKKVENSCDCVDSSRIDVRYKNRIDSFSLHTHKMHL